MQVVTGGCGFIGSNLIAGLNQQGQRDILVVDNLKNAEKFLNVRDLAIADYMDKQEFRTALEHGRLPRIDAIYHQGACSDTMEYNGHYMLDNNFTYSKLLLHFCLAQKIPLVYASSASVYGNGQIFVEQAPYEQPLNVYGYSKLLFDQYVRRLQPQMQSTVVGLRYFNVYGPREIHKGRMASMVYQLHQQLKTNGHAKLFAGSGGYGPGEQRRDFIFVADAVAINLFFAQGPVRQGIFNVGTGASRCFNDIAHTLIQLHGQGKVEYVAMPEGLSSKYQSFTQADISALRQAGYTAAMTSLEDGIAQYVDYLKPV